MRKCETAAEKDFCDKQFVNNPGWAKKTGLFLRVDNFAAVNWRKACYMLKVSEFCLEKYKTCMSVH